MFEYIRTHFDLVLTTFTVAFVFTTVSPIKIDKAYGGGAGGGRQVSNSR